MGTYENLSKSEGWVQNYNYKIKSTNAKPKAQIHKYEFNTQIQMGTDKRHMSLFQWARLISVTNTNTKCHKYKYKVSQIQIQEFNTEMQNCLGDRHVSLL